MTVHFDYKNPHTRLNYERSRMKTALMNGIKNVFNFIVITEKKKREKKKNENQMIMCFYKSVLLSVCVRFSRRPDSRLLSDRDSFTWTNITSFSPISWGYFIRGLFLNSVSCSRGLITVTAFVWLIWLLFSFELWTPSKTEAGTNSHIYYSRQRLLLCRELGTEE